MKRPVEGALIHSSASTLPGQLLAMVSGKEPNGDAVSKLGKAIGQTGPEHDKSTAFWAALSRV